MTPGPSVGLPARATLFRIGSHLGAFCAAAVSAFVAVADAVVTVDTSPSGRQQTIDGFGTCLAGTEGLQSWWRQIYFDDLRASMLRMDLVPQFKSPYSDHHYDSPWYSNDPALPGPDNNNVRVYTNAADYTRPYASRTPKIAVMGPNIDANIQYFDYTIGTPAVAGRLAQLAAGKLGQLGDFKLFGSLWSPAPWVKVSSGNKIGNQSGGLPVNGTPWPFIWGGNFAGGRLDVSGTPQAAFDDSSLGGAGPTSALTQFARCTAAYIRGFQNTFGVRLHAFSIQNELNFEEFYNSCTYPLSSQYLTALKAVRAELDKYPDLAPIRIIGPEDLLGGDPYSMWQYGAGTSTVHKNLQYLQNLAADPVALAAVDQFCIHGYASDGVNAAGSTPASWTWWANGWSTSPAAGIPGNVKGFTSFNKKSWMTETSGENPAWLFPASGFPNNGAWSIALKIHQALVAGRQSAWVYWQMTDGSPVAASTLTDATARTNGAKYVAAKHFFRFIRPGAVRVNASVAGSSALNASSFAHDANGTLTVVLVNASPDAIPTTLRLPAIPSGLMMFTAVTSSNGALWQSSTISPVDGQLSVPVPGYGVVTLYGGPPANLKAEAAGPGHVELRWPAAADGFVLESAPTLAPSSGWTPVTNPSTPTNGDLSVTLAAETPAGFFRLHHP
jgi:O-glycosyl hydrolase